MGRGPLALHCCGNCQYLPTFKPLVSLLASLPHSASKYFPWYLTNLTDYNIANIVPIWAECSRVSAGLRSVTMFQSAHYPIARVTMVTSSTPAIVQCPPSQWSALINTPSLHPLLRHALFPSLVSSTSSVRSQSSGGSFATFYRFFTAEWRKKFLRLSFVTKYCVNVTWRNHLTSRGFLPCDHVTICSSSAGPDPPHFPPAASLVTLGLHLFLPL